MNKNMAPKLSNLPSFEAFGVIFCPDFSSYFCLVCGGRGGGGHSRISEFLEQLSELHSRPTSCKNPILRAILGALPDVMHERASCQWASFFACPLGFGQSVEHVIMSRAGEVLVLA